MNVKAFVASLLVHIVQTSAQKILFQVKLAATCAVCLIHNINISILYSVYCAVCCKEYGVHHNLYGLCFIPLK